MMKQENTSGNEIGRHGVVISHTFGTDAVDMRNFAGGCMQPAASGTATFQWADKFDGAYVDFKKSNGDVLTMDVTSGQPQAMPDEVYNITGWMKITGINGLGFLCLKG